MPITSVSATASGLAVTVTVYYSFSDVSVPYVESVGYSASYVNQTSVVSSNSKSLTFNSAVQTGSVQFQFTAPQTGTLIISSGSSASQVVQASVSVVAPVTNYQFTINLPAPASQSVTNVVLSQADYSTFVTWLLTNYPSATTSSINTGFTGSTNTTLSSLESYVQSLMNPVQNYSFTVNIYNNGAIYSVLPSISNTWILSQTDYSSAVTTLTGMYGSDVKFANIATTTASTNTTLSNVVGSVEYTANNRPKSTPPPTPAWTGPTDVTISITSASITQSGQITAVLAITDNNANSQGLAAIENISILSATGAVYNSSTKQIVPFGTSGDNIAMSANFPAGISSGILQIKLTSGTMTISNIVQATITEQGITIPPPTGGRNLFWGAIVGFGALAYLFPRRRHRVRRRA